MTWYLACFAIGFVAGVCVVIAVAACVVADDPPYKPERRTKNDGTQKKGEERFVTRGRLQSDRAEHKDGHPVGPGDMQEMSVEEEGLGLP